MQNHPTLVYLNENLVDRGFSEKIIISCYEHMFLHRPTTTAEAASLDQGRENTHGDARQASLSWEARRTWRTHGARLSCRTHGTRSALLARLARPSGFPWHARCTGRTRISGGARLAGGTHGANHARRPRCSLVPSFALREGRGSDAKGAMLGRTNGDGNEELTGSMFLLCE